MPEQMIIEEYPQHTRKIVIAIENSVVGDGLWYPLVAQTLRKIADHQDNTEGAIERPTVFKTEYGDKVTIFAGSAFEDDEITL